MGFSGKVNWTSRLFAMLHRHNKMWVFETQSAFLCIYDCLLFIFWLYILIMDGLVVDCMVAGNCSNFTKSSLVCLAGITFQDPASCIYPDAG